MIDLCSSSASHPSFASNVFKLSTSYKASIIKPRVLLTMPVTVEEVDELWALLRNRIGDYPHWNRDTVGVHLLRGASELSIRAEYRIMVKAYNDRMLMVRETTATLRGMYGERSSINEKSVLKMIESGMTDKEIMDSYREREEKERATRSAKALLEQLRRDIGQCDMVDEKKVLRWREKNLSTSNIVAKYRWQHQRSRFLTRAEELRPRLVRAVGNGFDMSDAILVGWFEAGHIDDEIVGIFREMANKSESQT